MTEGAREVSVRARVCVCVSVLMFRVLAKHGAKGAPMKKGVKHIEEHFSVSGRKAELEGR